jgi:acyl-CoA thioesterase-2
MIPTPTSAGLLGSLNLSGGEDDLFLAAHQRIPSGRAYGGELVAQAVVAATRTVDPQRAVHSVHGYFLRPADVTAGTAYQVERVRDGRSFSARQVRAVQNGKVVFQAMASFQVPTAGVAHADPLPVNLPDPESLPASAEVLAGTSARDSKYWSGGRSFDMRHWPSPVYLTVEGDRTASQVVWIRAFEKLPDDPALHRAALAYLCDYTMLEPALRRHGAAWADEGLMTASLDHAMWWHQDGRADDWLAFVQRSPVAAGGRASGLGLIYTRSGDLLATVAQEGLVTVP